MNKLEIILFCITFLYTVIRWITLTKLFDKVSLQSIHGSFNLNDNVFWLLLGMAMWVYQIQFWGCYFEIIPKLF